VSDIFNEVDEELRREQLRGLWQRHGAAIVALAFLVVIAVGGWRGYQWWESRKAAEAGALFESALSLSEQGKHAEAQAALAKVEAEGTAAYRMLARFRQAADLAERDPAAAVKAYDELVADRGADPVMQDLAAVRAGLILVDTATLEEMNRRLEALTGADRAFRHSARELLALAAWRANDAATARRWLETITADADTPAGIRGRVETLSALLPAEAKS
jgi:hypothetical protein